MKWHQLTVNYIWLKGPMARIGKERKYWYAKLSSHHQHDGEVESYTAFSEGLPCMIHSWDDVIWQVSVCFTPLLPVETFFLLLSRDSIDLLSLEWPCRWEMLCSHTQHLSEKCLSQTPFRERKPLSLKLESSMVRDVLGWKRERSGTKQIITWFVELNGQHTKTVMVCEANPQCRRAQHYAFQDQHQAALTSMYHGQLSRA